MTLSTADKRVLSDVRFAKAREALDDARANLAEERLNTAANRSYYAALKWSTCIADSRWGEPGVPRGCHDDPRASLHQDETVAGQRLQDFKTLLTRRADSDYGDFESVSRSEAADSVVRADRLLNQIDMLRKRLAAEL